MRVRRCLGLELAPVRDGIGTIAVNLQPRERVLQNRAVQQSALRPYRGLDVNELRLDRDDLLQSLEVAPGYGQYAKLDSAFERIRREALAANQPEWVEERAGEDRVGQ